MAMFLVVTAFTIVNAACDNNNTASPAPITASTDSVAVTVSSTGGVNPNAPEVVEPGDIPDNQVFVTYVSANGTSSVKVPEGWARSDITNGVLFSDKFNSIAVTTMPTAGEPSVDGVRAAGLLDVSADPTFVISDIQPVTRHAGTGVIATYEIGSGPNEVTGKRALLAVERYVFAHNGTTVTLTLSAAKGADNVDPWKVVSDSLEWAA